MKTESLNNLFKEKIGVKISIIITLISILSLIATLIGSNFNNDNFEMFAAINIIIQLPYGVIVTFKFLRNKQKYEHLIPFLFLNWFIGCFSTNIFINIFENLPIWVYCITFLFCLTNFIIYSTLQNINLSRISYFLNGTSILLIVYFAVFLIPISPLSVIGILVLGMGFYGLVPMIILIVHLIILFKKIFQNKQNAYAFSSGITVVIVVTIIFTLLLNNESAKINQNGITKTFNDNNTDLPNYITISQKINPNFLNEILLKKDIVYIETENFFQMRGFDGVGNKQYNERKTHDPFLNIAYHFTQNIDLSYDDKINILKSNFDKRLETEEQLWSGKDVITKNIKEDVKIYPNDRLAYTEITMDIVCDDYSWRQNEAIYSFQLPEGSVATSLSLWVNGIERKGVLTTKEKAKKAYNQIVGVESRDPSLMQWKEGNRVTVRVFPITREMPRTFKCGFTTPLKITNNKLVYQSLSIKGPNINNANTLSRIQVNDNTTFKASKNFELENNFYTNNDKGLDKWKAEIPLNKKTVKSNFVWKNKSYEVQPITKQKISFVPSEIILDLTSNWKIEEIEVIVNIPNKKYFVLLNNKKQEINNSNFKQIFSQFDELNYSLLPLYNFKENSLIITKNGTFSSNFEELESSDYLAKIIKGTKEKNIKAINISEEINPFWQTIKEQKYVDYIKTDLTNCLNLIQNNTFIKYPEKENTINIETAGISIEEKPLLKNTTSNGSNHLYRMYCFGKVLNNQIEIQNDSLQVNKYVDLAKDANIVTPISSLIVLEADADYKNNSIEKNTNTLGNASINNDGAVPEPHEWAMIIIALSMILLYYRKHKLAS